MSTLSRYRNIHHQPNAVFTWQQVSRNHYRLLCGSEVHGTLALSLEPSILFTPKNREFYRAAAKIDGQDYSFKCVFLNGEYRGSLMTMEGLGQPLALFENHSSFLPWCRRSRIVLCEDGTIWPWVRGEEKGHWIVRGGTNRILELQNNHPNPEGTVHVSSPSLLRNPHSGGLILFCVYLAIGPQRAAARAV